ncbi:MAG TPA: murein biosynthesis integral membrane protein MurJ [Kiritimatiellia bacterium]
MEKSRVIRSAFKVGGFTLLSRFLGLLRDTVTAAAFGTSAAMSDFVVAFRLPNMFRAMFGEGALSSAFVPVFMDTRHKEGEAAAWVVARKVISLLGMALVFIVLACIGITFALERWPGLVENAPTVLPLARIMMPYMLFICLAALSQAILNSYHRFSLPAFTPSLLNITWILFVLLICPRLGATMNEQIYGVAWGVFVAGLVQLAAQIPMMIKLGYKPGFELGRDDPRVSRFLRLMGPTALGSSVSQVNFMVNGIIARWAAPWAPATLFFAERLLYFPQGILATALSTVLLPVFSGHAAQDDRGQMRDTLNHALRTLLFVMAPASVGLMVLAGPITQLVFGWGMFDQESVSHTAQVLQFYAPGLFVFGLAKVFVPAFYALQDTRTPFRNGLVSVSINFALNIVFTLTLPRDWKASSLALAAVVSEGYNGIALGWKLHRVMGSPGWPSIVRSAARSLVGAVAMGAVVLFAHGALVDVVSGLHEKLAQAVAVLGSIAIGAGFYFAVAALTRSPEMAFVRDALGARTRVDSRS